VPVKVLKSPVQRELDLVQSLTAAEGKVLVFRCMVCEKAFEGPIGPTLAYKKGERPCDCFFDAAATSALWNEVAQDRQNPMSSFVASWSRMFGIDVQCVSCDYVRKHRPCAALTSFEVDEKDAAAKQAEIMAEFEERRAKREAFKSGKRKNRDASSEKELSHRPRTKHVKLVPNRNGFGLFSPAH